MFESELESAFIPLFPLPGICLLPGELLPLYVFESRYRQMIQDAMAGDRLIAMAPFLPGWEEEYFGNPEVHGIFGVGKIVAHRPCADGTSHVVLRGVARVRLQEVVQARPYRLVRVVDLPEKVSDHDRLEELLADVARRVFGRGDGDQPHQIFGSSDPDPHQLIGMLAEELDLDQPVKQQILETDDLVWRLELVMDHLLSRSGHLPVFPVPTGHSNLTPNPN